MDYGYHAFCIKLYNLKWEGVVCCRSAVGVLRRLNTFSSVKPLCVRSSLETVRILSWQQVHSGKNYCGEVVGKPTLRLLLGNCFTSSSCGGRRTHAVASTAVKWNAQHH